MEDSSNDPRKSVTTAVPKSHLKQTSVPPKTPWTVSTRSAGFGILAITASSEPRTAPNALRDQRLSFLDLSKKHILTLVTNETPAALNFLVHVSDLTLQLRRARTLL